MYSFWRLIVSTVCTGSIFYLNGRQTNKTVLCVEKLDINSDSLQSDKFEIVLFMTSLLCDVKIQRQNG